MPGSTTALPPSLCAFGCLAGLAGAVKCLLEQRVALRAPACCAWLFARGEKPAQAPFCGPPDIAEFRPDPFHLRCGISAICSWRTSLGNVCKWQIPGWCIIACAGLRSTTCSLPPPVSYADLSRANAPQKAPLIPLSEWGSTRPCRSPASTRAPAASRCSRRAFSGRRDARRNCGSSPADANRARSACFSPIAHVIIAIQADLAALRSAMPCSPVARSVRSARHLSADRPVIATGSAHEPVP